MANKVLKQKTFNMEYELTDFVNKNNIKRTDIQTITTSMSCHLWYWCDALVSGDEQ